MWELYDELIRGIPRGPKVEAVYVGAKWTYVLSDDGNPGVAMTTAGSMPGQKPENFIGMQLCEAAKAVKSWSMSDASVGMAAINAWYNRKPGMTEEACSRLVSGDAHSADGFETKGKNIVLIGCNRSRGGYLEDAVSVKILDREDHGPEVYPDSACEYLIPEADMIIVTGSAFINKTMPRLLELAKSGGRKREVIITGPSTPMACGILKFGIDRLAGMVVEDAKEMMNFIADGRDGNPYLFGSKFYTEYRVGGARV